MTEVETHHSNLPDLKTFLQENAEPLYNFCFYLVQDEVALDDLMLPIFRDFGDEFRTFNSRNEGPMGLLELRVELFRLAWERVKGHFLPFQSTWNDGRDTRGMKHFDEDLLKEWRSGAAAKRNQLDDRVVARVRRLDLDSRAPLILKDVLGLDDEEVVKILGLRWGVYRHRLHRGRMDLRDELRGHAVSNAGTA